MRCRYTLRFIAMTCVLMPGMFLGGMGAGFVSAEEALADLNLDPSTEVVLAADINGLPAKTKLLSSPSFAEYSLEPVVDGIRKRKELNWQACSWASAEEDSPHGIEIQLSKPQRGGRFQVSWAYDIHNAQGGQWWISRNYLIQIKNKAGDPWKTAVDVKNNQSAVGSYPLPDEEFNFLRIFQPVGGGHPDRPHIMWVGQVELVE